jgi:hypothetical protein
MDERDPGIAPSTRLAREGVRRGQGLELVAGVELDDRPTLGGPAKVAKTFTPTRYWTVSGRPLLSLRVADPKPTAR